MPDNQDKGFVKTVSESGANVLGGFASSYIQIAQALIGIVSWLTDGPDIQSVLNRLNDISTQISEVYFELRDLILRETARIIDEIDLTAQRQELAKASAAYSSLGEYLRSQDREQLELANPLSAEAVAYFLQVDSTTSITAFVYCVLIRIAVIRELVTPPWFTQKLYFDEVTGYVNHLNDLIQQVIRDVEASHVIGRDQRTIGKPPDHGFALNFFVHSQKVRDYSATDPNAPDAVQFIELDRIEFADDSTRGPGCRLPTEEQASAAIERARAVGIENELKFLSIPAYVEVRTKLQVLLDQGFFFTAPGPSPRP